jgi:hypothetical protein
MDKKEEIRAEIDRLYRFYYEKDKEFESAKMKRFVLAILGFSFVYLYILYILWEPSGWDVLYTIVLSIVFSGLHCFINSAIFGALAYKGRDEGDTLRHIKERIANLEKELQ